MSVEDFKALFLILGPLVGVVVGGLIATAAKLVELRHSRKTNLQNRRLERIESIYNDTNELLFRSSRFAHFLESPDFDRHDPIVKTKFDEYLDEISALNGRAHAAHNLYLVEGGIEWEAFTASVAEFVQVCSDFMFGLAPCVNVGKSLKKVRKMGSEYQIVVMDEGRSVTKLGAKESKKIRLLVKRRREEK